MYFLYMIKDVQRHLYVGITDNPERRLNEHNNSRGALYTKYTKNFSIVFLEEYKTLDDSRKREIQIKKWSRSKKEKLIELYNQGTDTRINSDLA